MIRHLTNLNIQKTPLWILKHCLAAALSRMKSPVSIALLSLALLFPLEVNAQFTQDPNDPGIADTVALVLKSLPDGPSSTFEVEVWVFSDNVIMEMGSGYKWDELATTSKVQVVSAVATPTVIAAFDLVRLFWEDSVATTNANNRFLFGGYSHASAGLAGSGGRRLIATYTFATTADWSITDFVTVDTSSFGPESELFLKEDLDNIYTPYWTGAITIANVSAVASEDGQLPASFALTQNYPNPFNPITTIGFSVPSRSWVNLSVYNSLGRRVVTLVDEPLSPGNYTHEWDATNGDGARVASGVYFYKMTSDGFVQTNKMVLVK